MQKFKTPLLFAVIVFGTAFLLAKIGFTREQVISASIFLLIICGTLFYWQFRVTFAFAGIATLLATKLLDIPHVIEHAGLDIILFLVGMMCHVGHIEEKPFFEYIIAKVI